MRYRYARIGDFCSNVITGGTPLTSISEYYDDGTIPWLKTKEVNFSRIYSTEYYITKKGLAESSAKLIPANSVIVAMYGQGDTAGRVAINKIPVTTNQACCNLVINEDEADYRFIYYALKNSYKELVSMKNGGAQPNLNTTLIKGLQIPAPLIEHQIRIADILSAYDDLIENNQKQIKLLEEAAMRLYKEWFVYLRFPGHENTRIVDGMPEGWEHSKLKDFIDVNLNSVSKNYTFSDIQYIDISSVNCGCIENKTAYRLYDAPGRAKRLANDGDTIWGMVRPNLRAYALILSPEENVVFSTGFAVLSPKRIPYSFLYCLVTQDSFVGYLVNCTNGAAYPAVKPIHFEEADVTIPNETLLTKFNSITDPMFRKIKVIDTQINLLRQARDTLLPKLMSGEIEVNFHE
jgi:type I restriction enzyme S subunit